MRSTNSESQGGVEAKPHRKNKRAILASLLLCFLFSCVFSSCVHVGAGAGYWHTNSEGETTAKQASFDTANYIPGSSTAGKITV